MQFEMCQGGIPAGQYVGELVGVEEFTGQEEKYGKGVLFKWTVLEGDQAGQTASRITGRRLTPKSALAKVLTSLRGGGKIEQGEVIDPADYIGQRYLLIVEETDNGSTRVETVLKQA